MNGKKRIIIAGAGIAGLTLAWLLSRDGHDVVLVEKQHEVGGLARSFKYDDFIFDVGPHRFYSEFPEVMAFVKEILKDDYLEIERKSGVWMFEKYFEWPLSFSSLFRMPPNVLFSVARDFIFREKQGGQSFEEYIINKYGRTLYGIFFKPYTEKFLNIPCREVSREWAITGIDRAVIDKKIRVNDLWSLATSLLFSNPPLKFIYPRSGGIGVFAQKLGRGVTENGCQVLLDSEISGVVREGNKIRSVVIGGDSYECDWLVWTAPINEIYQLLGYGATGLDYLSLILFNYRLDEVPMTDYQWCYYGSADVPFNRISVPSLFNPALAPPGKAGLCVEVTCRTDDPVWHTPEELEAEVRKSLATVRCISGVEKVQDFSIEKIRDAYPVYSLKYRHALDKVTGLLAETGNLRLLGRTGAFWYNNMDHSIDAALALHKSLLPLL